MLTIVHVDWWSAPRLLSASLLCLFAAVVPVPTRSATPGVCDLSDPLHCPEFCLCAVPGGGSASTRIHINCSGGHLHYLPAALPRCLDASGQDLMYTYALNLTRNHVTRIAPEDVRKSYVPLLEVLDVSDNHMRDVAALTDSEASLPSLRGLYLHGNAFSAMPANLPNATWVQNLTTLSLHDNPWSCDCDMQWMQSWIRNMSAILWQNASDIRCDSPKKLRGQEILDVDFENVACRETRPGQSFPLYAIIIIVMVLVYLVAMSVFALCAVLRNRLKTSPFRSDSEIE